MLPSVVSPSHLAEALVTGEGLLSSPVIVESHAKGIKGQGKLSEISMEVVMKSKSNKVDGEN